MTSMGGFTAHRKEALEKIGDYPQRETPDGTKSRSDITKSHTNISEGAGDQKTEDGKGDETPTKSKKSKKSTKKGKDKEEEKKDAKAKTPPKGKK